MDDLTINELLHELIELRESESIDESAIFGEGNRKYAAHIKHAARMIVSNIQNYTVSALTIDKTSPEEVVVGEVTFSKERLMKPVVQLILSYHQAWEYLCEQTGISEGDLAKVINYELNPAALEAIKDIAPDATTPTGAAAEIVNSLLDEKIALQPNKSVH